MLVILLAIALVGGISLLGGWLLWRVLTPVLVRVLSIVERRLDILEASVNRPSVPKAEVMPTDLVMEALSESPEWARQDKLRWLNEQYAEHGSWDTVRNLLALRVAP